VRAAAPQLLTVHDAECVDTEDLILASEEGWDELEGESGGDGVAAAHAAEARAAAPRLWKVRARRTWRWASEALQICDVLAVLPFYLEVRHDVSHQDWLPEQLA
jgi:hypothetical protein